MNNNRGAVIMGLGLVTGLTLGTAVGLLYAPRPGKETRALIKNKASTMVAGARDRMHPHHIEIAE